MAGINQAPAAPRLGVNLDFAEKPLCRWCWRPVYLAYSGTGPPGDPASSRWDLVYLEYENTLACDARSDGAVLSQLPHEPCGAEFVSIATLIKNAARLASEPGTKDAGMRNAQLAAFVCLAAGVPEEQEPWARTAIILEACNRSAGFRAAAYRSGASDWPTP